MEKKEQNINSLLLKVKKEFKETQDLIKKERSLILDLRSKLELNKKKEKRL